MIRITPEIVVDENEIEEDFVRAGGSGGQNVNKVSTAVQLRFDVAHSPSLPEDVRGRLIRLAGKRVTDEGVLVIQARRFRTQRRNREDAMDRLITWIRKAAEKKAPRRKTRPSAATKRKRLEDKRRHGELKRRRKPVPLSKHEDH